MHKKIITVAAMAVLLAVVGFIVVVVKSHKETSGPAAPVVVADARQPPQSRVPAVKVLTTSVAPQTVDQAKPAEAIASSDSIVKNLTDAENALLLRLLRERQQHREWLHQLPTRNRLEALNRYDQLVLSAAQKNSLAAIQASLDPKIEAAMLGKMAREDEIQKLVQANLQAARAQSEAQNITETQEQYDARILFLNTQGPNAPLLRELSTLCDERDRQQQLFDAEYESLARPLLTPAQIEALDWMAGRTKTRPAALK